MPEAKTFQRLPKNVIPKNYQVSLQPDLKTCTYKGSVKIDIEVKETTCEIILNSLDLKIGNVSLLVHEKAFVPFEVKVCTASETLTLTFECNIEPAIGQLDITFDGVLNDQLKGFYRSKYTVDSELRYGAVTQFESTDARRCFPCWDEPAIKATFDVTLTVPDNRIALSNMNVVQSMQHPTEQNWRIVKFARSPIMSTYLVAFIVGEYDYVEQILPNGVVVRVYTPLGKKNQGEFALEVASKVLPYFEDYFQIKYPLPKLDLIAIADFTVGAMENWGLVTYREAALLVDSKNTSTIKKQYIATVIAHETAHQWFGNLVTMEWWTHLWLNEGYATFGQFLCTNVLFPEYDIWKQFVTDSFVSALESDALNNSHPIEVPVGHPAEVEEIFDDISYDKGASVIRMIHDYIGDELFRKGMNCYLERHKYGNTQTNDLWRALSEASGKPIDEVMKNWTLKVGFPLITVTSCQEGKDRKLTLQQRKFDSRGSSDKSDVTVWKVPMTFLSPTMYSPFEYLLESSEGEIVLKNVDENDWVKINVNSIGFYRVKYPAEMLNQLINAVSSKSLSSIDRLGIIDDLFALVQAGSHSAVDLLKFLKSYKDEEDYVVWTAVDNILCQLNHLLSHTSFQDLFKSYALKLLSKIAQKLGWEPKPNEAHLDTLLRSLILVRMGVFGDESVIEECCRRFSDHVKDTFVIPADLRSVVYRSVMKVADEATFEQMITLYRKAEFHEEKRRISGALGVTEDPVLIQKILDFSLSDDVRSQDTYFFIASLSGTRNGRNLSWKFLKNNIKKLCKIYSGGPLLVGMVKSITKSFASEQMALEVEEFFRNESIPEAERSLKQAAECIRLKETWLKRDSKPVETFLAGESTS